MIFEVGAVACYTGLILWRLFCSLDSDRYPVKTYSDLCGRIFGPWFKNMATVLQSLQLIINVNHFPQLRLDRSLLMWLFNSCRSAPFAFRMRRAWNRLRTTTSSASPSPFLSGHWLAWSLGRSGLSKPTDGSLTRTLFSFFGSNGLDAQNAF